MLTYEFRHSFIGVHILYFLTHLSPLIYSTPFFKICHPPKKTSKMINNQLIKIDDLRIDYSEEEYTYINEQNFLHFMVHINITLLLKICIAKFNVVLSFQNFPNVDIVYICFMNDFFFISYFYFLQSIFFAFKSFPYPTYLASLPVLKNFLYHFPCAHFSKVLSPLIKEERNQVRYCQT